MSAFAKEAPVARLSFTTPSSIDGPIARQFQRIYASSFRLQERVPFGAIEAALASCKSTLVLAKLESSVLGFALITPLRSTPAVFLDYLAVRNDIRGQGIGTKLLRATLREAHLYPGACGLLLEVRPLVRHRENMPSQNMRRLLFYERNGAVQLPDATPYAMPSLAGPGAVPMLLMWLPFDQQDNPSPPVPPRRYITSIYKEVYGRSRRDPLLARILARLPAPCDSRERNAP